MKNSSCLENEWTLTLSQSNSGPKKEKAQSCTIFCGLKYNLGAVEIPRDPMDSLQCLWGALRTMRARRAIVSFNHLTLMDRGIDDQRVQATCSVSHSKQVAGHPAPGSVPGAACFTAAADPVVTIILSLFLFKDEERGPERLSHTSTITQLQVAGVKFNTCCVNSVLPQSHLHLEPQGLIWKRVTG